ncbi:hypothetical protein C5167_025400 [Papaver somniferum]|uniref:Uncharacterized protein n=1 Tax=Papaver somniferum TaxID=3469 RepID=A0A4Y7JRB5_PAPSO|nr:hypothetical protein C5167_025400 [Papaver somniferum]
MSKDSKDVEVQGVTVEVPEILLRYVSRDEAAVTVARDVFKSLYRNTSNNTHVGAQIATLVAIRAVCKLALLEQLTSFVVYSDDKSKFKKDIIEYGVCVSEIHNLIEALAKLAARPGSPEFLPQLLVIARDVSANAPDPSGYIANNDEKVNQSRDGKAQSVLSSVSRGKTIIICEATVTNDAAVTRFVSQLQKSGLLSNTDCLSPEGFTSGSLSLQSLQQVPVLSFVAIDMYASRPKLVFLILKYCAVDQGSTKLFLLPKILLVTAVFRLFLNWLLDLCSHVPVLEGASFQILTAFAKAFHPLQPLKVPGFRFAQLELVIHMSFIPKLLYGNSQKISPYV